MALDRSVLVAGRPGFLLEPLRRRFLQENVELYSASAGEFLKAQAAVAIHNVNELIYFPGDEVATGDFSHLQTALELAAKQHVETFMLVSSASVFGAEQLPAAEDTAPHPDTAEGQRLRLAEELVLSYARELGLRSLIIRMTTPYGPGLTEADAAFAAFATAADGGVLAAADYVYVDDAVFAIYQAFSRQATGVLHVAAGTALEATATREAIGWSPRYTLADGQGATITYIRNYVAEQAATSAQERARAAREAFKQKIIPFVENGVGFVLMALFAMLQNGTPVNSLVYFDLNYIYIGTLGMLYGKTQALISFVLSSVILAGCMILHNAELVSLLYVPQYLLHFTSYLFVAVLCGYFADHKRFQLAELNWDKSQIREQYEFLKAIMKDTIKVKDKLYRQIVNMDDSIGRIYRIVRRLDRVERENIFTQAAAVTAEVMGVHDVALYVTSPNKAFLRRKIHLGRTDLGGLSRDVEAHSYLRQVVRDNEIFVNRDLLKDAPDLAAPITYRGDVVAVIEIREMDIEQWTLAQQNLLSITCRLVSDAIARAYRYEAEAMERKFIAGTRIMQADEFDAIYRAMEDRRELAGGMTIATVIVEPDGLSVQEISAKLTSAIRAEDYVGVHNGEVTILLTDVTDESIAMVQSRLERAGLASRVGVKR